MSTKPLPKGFSAYSVKITTDVVDMMKEGFSSITETRRRAQVRHNLFEIIAMAIGGIANCDSRHEIEDFCRH